MGLHYVGQTPNEWDTKCARQCSEHIDSPEFSVRQPKHRLPLCNRGGYEIRLSKTRKVREHESAGEPTKVAPYEFKHNYVSLFGGEADWIVAAAYGLAGTDVGHELAPIARDHRWRGNDTGTVFEIGRC